jgi:hypothetical protein
VIDLEIRVFQRYRRLPDIADRVVRWSTACDRLGGRPVVAWHGWSADGRFVLFMKAGNGGELQPLRRRTEQRRSSQPERVLRGPQRARVRAPRRGAGGHTAN